MQGNHHWLINLQYWKVALKAEPSTQPLVF